MAMEIVCASQWVWGRLEIVAFLASMGGGREELVLRDGALALLSIRTEVPISSVVVPWSELFRWAAAERGGPGPVLQMLHGAPISS